MAIVSTIILFLCLVGAALMFQRLVRSTEVSRSEAEAEGYSDRVAVLAKQKTSFRALWFVYMALSAVTLGASFYLIVTNMA